MAPGGRDANVEDGGLIFFIGAGVVGVVAKQQPDIGVARAGVGVIRVAVRHLPDAIVRRRLRQNAGEIIDQLLVSRINAVLDGRFRAGLKIGALRVG